MSFDVHSGARSFRIILPCDAPAPNIQQLLRNPASSRRSYYPTGTMERVEIEGQVATAHTMAMMFSSIPPSRSGPVDIFIVDIHALQERFYFDPRSSVINPISAIEIFVGRLLAK